MFAILIILLCLGVCCNGDLMPAVITHHRMEIPLNRNHNKIVPLRIDLIREQFWQLESKLWQYLNGNTKGNYTVQQQSDYILDEYRKYLQDTKELGVTLVEDKYNILNHYEWSVLEKQLLAIERTFDVFYQFITNDFGNDVQLRDDDGDPKNSILQYALLFNDNFEDIKRTIENILLIMVKQTMYYRALMVSVH